MLVENGKAVNKVVSPYNNSWSKAKAYYCPVTHEKKTIKNLKFFRRQGNKELAFFVTIANMDNVVLSNIEIHTPKDTLLDDSAIGITNCTNVKLCHVTIDGTYSRKDHSGYGIMMNNVWNSYFYKLNAHGNWGVFGDNNISLAKFVDCDINRFDIHCYGRDIYFRDCVFRNVYNQFSSVFGEIVFKRCEFINCFPVAFGASYNAYTKVNLVVKDCIVKEINKKNYFIFMNGIQNPVINERPELAKKEWPDIYIDGLTIVANKNQSYRLSNFSRKEIKLGEETIPTHIELKRIKYEQ